MINIDQKYRLRKIDEPIEVDELMVKSMIVFLVFAALSVMFAVFSVDNSTPTYKERSVVGVTTDNLMSEERAEFMMIFENGQEFDEGDMRFRCN